MSNIPPHEVGVPEHGTPTEPTKRQNLHQAVAEIARLLAPKDHAFAITGGDVAALRRMHQGTRPAAFWRLLEMVLVPRGLVIDLEDERRWADIIGLMAEAAGQHVGGKRLGTALSEAKVAETRVLRVLNAQGDALVDALRYAIRPLVVGGIQFDQLSIAELILSDGHPDIAESPRHAIARAFYGAEFKKTQPETP